MPLLCEGSLGLISRGRKDRRRPSFYEQQLGQAWKDKRRREGEISLGVKRQRVLRDLRREL